LSEGFKHIISTANTFGVAVVYHYQATRLPLIRGNKGGEVSEAFKPHNIYNPIGEPSLPRHADNVFAVHFSSFVISLNLICTPCPIYIPSDFLFDQNNPGS
jgi:hypothetical protein